MRYTISDLRRHHTREDIAGWWYELPWRRWRNIRALLLDTGEGWLRWKHEPVIGDFPDDDGIVAPPLRRAWWTLHEWAHGYRGVTSWQAFKSDRRWR